MKRHLRICLSATADSISASLEGFLKSWDLFTSAEGNWGQGRNLHCAHFRAFQILKNENVLLILTRISKPDTVGLQKGSTFNSMVN